MSDSSEPQLIDPSKSELLIARGIDDLPKGEQDLIQSLSSTMNDIVTLEPQVFRPDLGSLGFQDMAYIVYRIRTLVALLQSGSLGEIPTGQVTGLRTRVLELTNSYRDMAGFDVNKDSTRLVERRNQIITELKRCGGPHFLDTKQAFA
jgi:hypothetical protein